MKIKLSALKKMIREEYNNVLAHDEPEDVDMLEKDWGVNPDKELVDKVDYKKAAKVKESRRARRMPVSELRKMVLKSLSEYRKAKTRKR